MKRDALSITLVQDNPVVGDIEGNTQKVIFEIGANIQDDLIVFSECFLTGYPLGDLVMRPGFLTDVAAGIEKVRAAVIAARGPSVLVGAPLAGSTLPYNAAYLIEPNGSVRTVCKTELPNNDVFDEVRTFARSSSARPMPLSFHGFQLGIQICEDMWHGSVSRSLSDELADVLIVLNGSPYHVDKQKVRIRNAEARVRATGLPLVYVNQIGGQDELVFDGASFTMNADGAVCQGRSFSPDRIKMRLKREEAGCHIEIDEGYDFKTYPENNLITDYRACVMGLRDYIAKNNMPHVFVGVSGGLDSALVLTMAVDAIGANRVVGVMMPTRHTSQESLDLADDLMTRLCVHKMVIPISDTFETMSQKMTDQSSILELALGRVANNAIADENYQARIRGMTLMGLTNSMGGIVLSTGNKSEMSVGYATLYGDMCGGFNPLKSVYKTRAFEMARLRNTFWSEFCADISVEPLVKRPIPDEIINRPPSAELAEGQTDEKSLGEYKILDSVLRLMIEEKHDAPSAARQIIKIHGLESVIKMTGGILPEAYAAKIGHLIRISQYKRDQSPPGVKLNPTDFGLGWRYPIAGKYKL